MNMKRIFLSLFTICCFAIMLYSCRQASVEMPVKVLGTFSSKGSVREITLSPIATEFPEHEGKAEFISYCAICHSLKYISSQPDFPQKTWDVEVHKMVKIFGAPIDSNISKKIVAYLVAVKSTRAK
jgi:hypothetical protein